MFWGHSLSAFSHSLSPVPSIFQPHSFLSDLHVFNLAFSTITWNSMLPESLPVLPKSQLTPRCEVSELTSPSRRHLFSLCECMFLKRNKLSCQRAVILTCLLLSWLWQLNNTACQNTHTYPQIKRNTGHREVLSSCCAWQSVYVRLYNTSAAHCDSDTHIYFHTHVSSPNFLLCVCVCECVMWPLIRGQVQSRLKGLPTVPLSLSLPLSHAIRQTAAFLKSLSDIPVYLLSNSVQIGGGALPCLFSQRL